MDHITENIEKLCSWFLVSLSSVTTIFCFVFLIRNGDSNKTKENIVVLLCSISSLTYAVIHATYDLHYSNNESLQLSGYICFAMRILYKSSFATSRCCCNLIFLYRYKTINNRISIFAVKKAYCFSVGIIVVTVLKSIFDLFFSFWAFDTKNSDCFRMTLKSEMRIYLISMASLYLLVAVFQTIILCEIIKPIFKHCTRLNSSALSSNNLRRSFYRVVLSTLVFSLSDFGSLAIISTRITLYEVRTPMVVVINLIINTLSLMCSYDNYKTRLFPFLCCLEVDENNQNTPQGNKNSTANREIASSSQNRSILKTIDATTEEDRAQSQDTIVIHPNIILEIPVSFKTCRN